MGGKAWGAAGSQAVRLPFWEAWLRRARGKCLKGRSSSVWRWAVPSCAPSSSLGKLLCQSRWEGKVPPLPCLPEVKSCPHGCCRLRGEGGATLPVAPGWGQGEGPPARPLYARPWGERREAVPAAVLRTWYEKLPLSCGCLFLSAAIYSLFFSGLPSLFRRCFGKSLRGEHTYLSDYEAREQEQPCGLGWPYFNLLF